MANRYFWLTIPGSAHSGFAIVDAVLKEAGASLINPATKRVTYWNSSGDQIEISPDFFGEEDAIAGIDNVQYWLNGGCDVFVSWEVMSGLVKFSISLDGLPEDLASSVIGRFANFIIRSKYEEMLKGIVFAIEFE